MSYVQRLPRELRVELQRYLTWKCPGCLDTWRLPEEHRNAMRLKNFGCEALHSYFTYRDGVRLAKKCVCPDLWSLHRGTSCCNDTYSGNRIHIRRYKDALFLRPVRAPTDRKVCEGKDDDLAADNFEPTLFNHDQQ